MLLDFLATELVLHVFLSCSSIDDVIHLSATCRRFRNIYASSQKLAILESAAEAQFGPLQDLTQLLTHNASQPAHVIRTVPFSIALLKQIVHAGRIAEKWTQIYPFKKWKYNYELRRLLTAEERYRVRRAIYRLWLYSRAFHNSDHPRESRCTMLSVQRRAGLLHNWSTSELAEIADVHSVLREVVQSNVCPSNGTISRKFKRRHPDISEHHLLFNNHVNHPSSTPLGPTHNPFSSPCDTSYFNNTPIYGRHYASSMFKFRGNHDVGAEGWGDDIPHYYIVEDMMKLDPEQIMWLKENAPLKGMVESYVRGLGDWFENNGETWGQTLEWVLDERGEDVGQFLEAVSLGHLGVAMQC